MSGGAIERAESDPIVGPQLRCLRWVLSLRDSEGRLVCPEHRVEHTGKSACVAVTAALLGLRLGSGELLEAAAQQGRRLLANLEREGKSPCFTFRPGRHDPFNCSNAVIDGGAAADALLLLSEVLEDAPERAEFRRAALLHARTYLRYAVLDKGIPAQRAWGLTGLAAAAAATGEPELGRAASEAVDVLGSVQNGDGSYPYHPLEWGAEHAGASDVSAFYQSRVTAFLLFALERLGRDPTGATLGPPLARGLAFAHALQGPDGLKVGLVEAKPWYWGATYEVASHPFDVYAFARGGELFGRPEWSRAALRALRAWEEHLSPDGAPRSHRQGPGRGRSYQCPLFWAAHACWIARATDALAAARERGDGGEARPAAAGGPGWPALAVQHFPDAGLVRLEDPAVVAWVRGARPPFNVHHGSPHGFGLLRALRRADHRELVARCRLGGHQEGEWSGLAGAPSLARGWRSGGSAVRFSAWLARVHARGGRLGAALLEPARTFRRGVLAFGHPRAGSAFTLAPEVAVRSDGVELAGPLSRRDGAPVAGTRLVRDFRVDGGGLRIEERLEARGPLRGVEYRVPAAAREVERDGDEVRYRLA